MLKLLVSALQGGSVALFVIVLGALVPSPSMQTRNHVCGHGYQKAPSSREGRHASEESCDPPPGPPRGPPDASRKNISSMRANILKICCR